MKISDARILLDAIYEAARFEPSKWEEDFMHSIEDQLDEERDLTQKQGDKLQQIYRKAQETEV